MSLASGPDGCLDAATGQKPHPTKTIHPSPTSRPWGRAGQGAGTRPPPIVQHLGSRPGFLSKHRGAAKGGGAMHPCHGTQHWGACGDHSGGGEGPRRLRTQDRCTFRPIPHPTSCFKMKSLLGLKPSGDFHHPWIKIQATACFSASQDAVPPLLALRPH